MHNYRGAQATNDGTPKYQRFPYYWPNCPNGFDITTQEECSEAIAYLGVTNGGPPWTGSRTTMPRFCSLQKNTDSMIFNSGPTGGQRRHDLAPVCKWTGKEAPPDWFRVSREKVTEWRGVEHTITVKPEEWDYFLAFQESRKNGFSCPCNRGQECNEIEAPGKHWYNPNPEKVTFDCTLWIAAWLHAEDQCIQGYFSHNSRDGTSARMRCEAVGAVYKGEHQAGWHATGLAALRGLQSSPGHCNSMFDPSKLGFAGAHGARRNDPRGNGDVWTVLYNGGGSDISDSESCIPAGYTATGERTLSQPTTPPQSTPSPTIHKPEPTTPTPPAPTTIIVESTLEPTALPEKNEIIPDGVVLLRNNKACFYANAEVNLFGCPIETTMTNRAPEGLDNPLVKIYGNSCSLDIRPRHWAYNGNGFFFQSQESLAVVKECFVPMSLLSEFKPTSKPIFISTLIPSVVSSSNPSSVSALPTSVCGINDILNCETVKKSKREDWKYLCNRLMSKTNRNKCIRRLKKKQKLCLDLTSSTPPTLACGINNILNCEILKKSNYSEWKDICKILISSKGKLPCIEKLRLKKKRC